MTVVQEYEQVWPARVRGTPVEERMQIIKCLEKGETVPEIAKRLGVLLSVVKYLALAKWGKEVPADPQIVVQGSGRRKLFEEEVQEMRRMSREEFLGERVWNNRELAFLFEVTPTTVGNVLSGRSHGRLV